MHLERAAQPDDSALQASPRNLLLVLAEGKEKQPSGFSIENRFGEAERGVADTPVGRSFAIIQKPDFHSNNYHHVCVQIYFLVPFRII